LKWKGVEPAILVICGPTATGKSQLGLELARRTGGEIISADAFQFYRGLDLGTAKPPPAERGLIPHHLVDCLDPEQPANAHWFSLQARKLAREIISRGHLPILVGGSGLYLKAFLDGFFELKDPAAAAAARKDLSGRPTVELYRELSRVDPVAAARIQPNDAYRIRRALEVFQAAGRPISRLQSERIPLDLPFIQIGVWRTREEIYRRIEKRVDEIFAAGFLEEVAALRRRYDFSQPAFEAIGYREAAAVLDGELNLEQARRLIAQKTRNYAKRQLTWFRKDRRILWLDFSGR